MAGDLKAPSGLRKQFALAGLAFVAASLLAARHLATWPVRLQYPGEASHMEGVPLAEMIRLRQGVAIYAPPSPERFSAALYGPLYYLLGARLVDVNKPAYFPLRMVSLLALLGCAVGCSVMAFWVGKSYLAAALAPVVFLAYAFVTLFGTSSRCDLAALFLFFAGFLIAYRFQNSRLLLLAVPLMVLGFFFKQQFLAGPLAVLIYLLLRKRYRLALEFVGLSALGALGLLGLFQFGVFRGQAFIEHFLFFNLLSPSRGFFLDGLLFFGLVVLWPALMALEFLRAHPDLLLSCYLGCAVVLSLLTVMRPGSDINYFLECVLILSFLLAAQLVKKLSEPRPAGWLLALLIVLGLGQWPACAAPAPVDFALDRAEQDFLRRNALPETAALGYYTGDLLRAGLKTPISDLYHYTSLIRKGTLSEHDLLTQLRKRRFGLITLNFDLEGEQDPERRDFYLTEPLCHAILVNYRLTATLQMPGPEKFEETDRLYVWAPLAGR